MFERNAPILETCKAVLIETPLRDWIEFIEKVASTIHLTTEAPSKRLSTNLFGHMGQ
jgi:hypothetical protein